MDNNYMKTILSGVKEWTENLTDDAVDKANNAIDKANNAIDKANNALDKANKSIDKALYVVNITENYDGTYSADKTFEEIVQAYNEGKYSIVAYIMGVYIMPPLGIISDQAVMFGAALNEGGHNVISMIIRIAPDNSIQMIETPLAKLDDKLPNPHPLIFAGAVSGSYDVSSAKTIEIPSGGGGAFTASYTVKEEVTSYTLNIDTSKYSGYVIFVRNSTNKAPSITINREHKRIGFTGYDANVNFFEINTLSSDDIFQGFSRLQKNNNTSAAYYSYGHSNHASGTTEENNGIVISAETIGAGSEIFVRCM